MRRTSIAGLILLASFVNAQIVVIPTKKKAPTPRVSSPAPDKPASTPAKPTEVLRYCSELGYLRIALHPVKKTNPPAELLLADAQKKRLGIDPLRGTDYSEIPRASYASDSQVGSATSRVIEVCSPATGYYTLQVIGTASGDYELDIQSSNREVLDSSGRPMILDSRADQTATSIRRGMTHTYTIYFSRTPGVKVRLRQNK